ncbi:TPR end-of-group domain-containing protein [Pendulispora albinea]|uniref:Tetratricopeptide repeat protein n=1 Tax=Pendulispora albinea TaxID=2741071 RepID=A0ABZ2M3Z4_9BACT
MFEGIDTIDWANLETSFGAATDVPRLLRSAAAEETKVREAALEQLEVMLYHEGERFPATPRAIPFLFDLALAPGTPARARILKMVMHFVGGACNFRDGLSLADGQRTIFAGKERDPQTPKEAQAVHIWRTCYNATRVFVPRVQELAFNGAEDVRVAASLLLGCYRTERRDIVPHLQDCFEHENIARVRAAQTFALGMLTHLNLDSAEFLVFIAKNDPAPLVRVVSSMVLAHAGAEAQKHTIVDALIEGLALCHGWLGIEYRRLPFGTEGLCGDIGRTLTRLPNQQTRSALPFLLDIFEHTEDAALIGVVRGILHAALGECAESPADARRIRACKAALLYNESVWQTAAITRLLEEWGLPSDRDAFGASIALSPESLAEGLHAFREGVDHASAEQYEQALSNFQRAAALLPHKRNVACNVVWNLKVLGRTAEGLAEVERALAVFDRSAHLHFEHGHLLVQKNEFVEGVDACTRGLQLDAADARTRELSREATELTPYGHYIRASAYARMGNPDKAVDDLRMAATLNRDFVNAMSDDVDFESLRSRADFQTLLSTASREDTPTVPMR